MKGFLFLFFFFFQPHSLLNRVKSCTTDQEQAELVRLTEMQTLGAMLLPVKSVGVQVSIYFDD